MAQVELTPEENLLLLREIEANRAFILLAYQSDPALLALADPQIRRLFDNAHETAPQTKDERADAAGEFNLPALNPDASRKRSRS